MAEDPALHILDCLQNCRDVCLIVLGRKNLPTIWEKDMENGFRKKSDIFYDKKAKEERSSTKDYSFLFHNFTKLYGGKS